MPYGCFVEIMPGKDGLLHISEIDWKRLETVEEAGLHEGDTITVKLVDIDPKTGKFKLSHRALIPKPEGYEERPPRQDRGPRNDRGDHRDNRGDRNDRGDRRDRGPRNDRPYNRGDRNDRGERHYDNNRGDYQQPQQENPDNNNQE